MTKTAFLFAGQGAQYLGMGRDLYDHYSIVKETIDQASQVLGYDLRHLIDTEEEKTQSDSLYATSYFSDFSCYLPFIARKGLSA